MGTPLFARGSRGVTLTPEGPTFLAYARQVLKPCALLDGQFIRFQFRMQQGLPEML